MKPKPKSHKVCAYCGSRLSIDMFHRNSSNSDGYASRCKNCRRILNMKRRIERTARDVLQSAHEHALWRDKRTARARARSMYAPWGPCMVLGCGRPGRLHHIDYGDPGAVLYLCEEHHLALHRTVRTLHRLAAWMQSQEMRATMALRDPALTAPGD